MDLQHARTLLDRINRVFDGFGAGAAEPSALERDLLREYVRRFYESLSDAPVGHGASDESRGRDREDAEPGSGAADAAAPPARHEPTRRPLSGRRLRESPAPRQEFGPAPSSPAGAAAASAPAVAPSPTALATASPTTQQPAAVPPARPAIIRVPDSVEADVRNIEQRGPQAASPPSERPQASQGASVPAAPAASPAQALGPELTQLAPALRELLARERGTGLGDRLGNAPIPDLTRALALNQRLVFQNELFGKSADSLRDALTELNNKDDYGDAARALVTMAREHNWTSDERQGPARDFVKLVQRRYPEA